MLLIVIVALWVIDDRSVYPFPLLNAGLFFVCGISASAAVAYLLGRSIVARGSIGLLLFGAGALVWGCSGFVAVVASLMHGEAAPLDMNAQATIHSVSAWLAALLHLSGTVLSLRGTRLASRRRLWTAVAYAAAVAAVGLIVLVTLSGRVPPFFIQGQGGTSLRHAVLGSSIAMLTLTAGLLLGVRRAAMIAFARWYAWALLLLATGLTGIMVISFGGSLLGWTSRAAQYLGSIYMVVAALAYRREAGAVQIGLESVQIPLRLLPRTIRNRLFLLLGTILLPVALLLAAVYWERYETQRKAAEQTEVEVAKAVATAFRAYVDDIRHASLAAGMAIVSHGPEWEKADALLAGVTRQYPALRRLSWVSREGRVLASTDARVVSLDLSARAFFARIEAGDEWYLSDMLPSYVDGTPVFAIATAVRDKQGVLRGILLASVDPERLGQLNLTLPRAGEAAYALFDRQGILVYRNPETKIGWHQRRHWLHDDGPLKHVLLTGQAGTAVVAGGAFPGERLSAHVPIPGLGWIAGASQPKEAALAPVREALLNDAIGAATVVLIAFLLAYLVGRTISLPLVRLSAGARALPDGRFVSRPEREEPMEVTHLRESVEHMTRALTWQAKTLQESELQHRTFFELASVGLCYVSLDGRFVRVNDRYLRLTGYSREEVLAMSVDDLTHPLDRASSREAFLDHLQRGDQAFCIEKRYVRKDGSVGWVLVDARVVLDEQRQPQYTIAAVYDITERKEAEQELQRRKEEFESLAENSPDVISRFDRDLKHLYISPAVERITGLPPRAFLGKTHGEVECLPADLVHRFEGLMREVFATGDRRGLQFDFSCPDGAVVSCDCLIVPERDGDGSVATILTIARDVTVLRRGEARLQFLATHDGLTGLPNRALLQERLQGAISRCMRNGTLGALLYLDLDQFKPVNDSLGHEVGDELLQAVASRIAGCVRKTDTVARLGGDEFAVLLEDIQEPQEAAWIAGNLIESLARPFLLAGHHIYISASIGIACCPQNGKTPETLLRLADTAMYKAKEDGKNCYHFFSKGMDRAAREKLQLSTSLRGALDRNELALVYQPRIAGDTGKMVGVEALIRWHNPEQGLVLPARFVGLAEETGMIEPIGEWVLATACRQLARWTRHLSGPFCVAVNISPRQFRQPRLAERIAAILEETRVDPASLELEITESVVMANPDKARKILGQLGGLGIRLSLDDFGTGHSSLAYLQRFPVHRLKIDQSFVQDLPGSRESANITRAIIAMARSLELQVTAEGVETEGQREFLLATGCETWQGYLFSEPVSAEEIEAMLERAGRSVLTT